MGMLTALGWDDPTARAREGGAFLATSRRPSGAASARPAVLHLYSLAVDGVGVVVVATGVQTSCHCFQKSTSLAGRSIRR
jgi:hypothetical protein